MAANASPVAKRSKTFKRVVMVTGGTGLVGMALKREYEKTKPENEEWIFLSGRDADLRSVFSSISDLHSWLS